MARFYGTVQGGRGQASRLGHANTGLHVTAQSYSGDVIVLFDAEGDTDIVDIIVRAHGTCGGVRLYRGPVEDLLKPAALLTFFKQAAADILKAA